MSMPPAKTTEGKPYSGNQLYAGAGIKRSCGKCRTHTMFMGGKVHLVYGWICPGCAEVKK
jgi:hypothetical protein